MPSLFARPELLAGVPDLTGAPSAILGGFVMQYGPLGGLGLLAGAGCGLLSIPTDRELEMLRRQLGHSAGTGSPAMRALLSSASVLARAGAMLQTFFTFDSAPIYVSVYILPLATAIALVSLGVAAVRP